MAPPFGLTCAASSGKPELRAAGERLRGEGLVELDDVDLAELQPERARAASRRRHRADAHDARRDAGRGAMPSDAGAAASAHSAATAASRGDDQRGGAVVDAGGVAGGHACRPRGTAVAQLRERLQRRLGARMLVALDDVAVALALRHRRPARSPARSRPLVCAARGPLLAAQREGVLVGARDLELARPRSRPSPAWSRCRIAPSSAGLTKRQPIVVS